MSTEKDTLTAAARADSPATNGSEATCAKCGKRMLYNVPRLGPAGGYVHAGTYSLLCEDEEEKLRAEVFDPNVSDLEYFQARQKHHKAKPQNVAPSHAEKNL